MNVNFSGFQENVVTFAVSGTGVTMGTPVKMASSHTVCACGDGDTMVGVAVNVRNGYAAVQLSGYIEMPCEGAFEVGYQKISVTGDGKAKTSQSGREYLVCAADSEIVGFIL